MAHVLESICATSTPGTMRNTSGRFVEPDRRMSSSVITKTADAVRESFSAFCETEVTSTFIKSVRLSCVRSGPACCGHAGAKLNASATTSAPVLRMNTLGSSHSRPTAAPAVAGFVIRTIGTGRLRYRPSGWPRVEGSQSGVGILLKVLYISGLHRRASRHRLGAPLEDPGEAHVNAPLKPAQKPIARLRRRPRFPYVVGISTPRESMKRVLVIEDDKDIVEPVRYNLEKDGFHVAASIDGATGLAQVRKTPPDILILDLMLPKLSGLEICKEVRKDASLNRLPALILTAKGEEADRVVGLELGADDYVTKPFSPRELVARVKALLRRTEPGTPSEKPIEIGVLRIDPAAYKVTRGGKAVPMS